MAFIDLFIPDAALCAAVVEQIRLSHLGEPRPAVDVEASWRDEAVVALVLDHPVLDKKLLKLLRDAETEVPQRNVFVLGEPEAEWGALVTESFTKPLRLGHLMSRLQFYLHMAPRLRATVLTFGPYRLEPQNRQLVVVETGQLIRLTEKETALLEYLGKSDEPVGREELLASIWGYDARIDTHTLETHIYQLRRKLDPAGEGAQWLVNEQGAYRLARGA